VERSVPRPVESHGRRRSRAPSACRTADDHYHVFYGSHATEQKHARSEDPDGISSWTHRPDIGEAVTYPQPNVVDGDVYLFLRESRTAGWVDLPEVVWKSTDDGRSWTRLGPIVDFHDERGGDFRIHTFKTIPVGTDVHFVWLFSDAGDNVRRNVYHAVDDTTAHSRRAQDGTPLSTPISRAEADAECLVFDSHARGEDTNRHRVDLDERDNPHVLFTHANDGAWEYRYAYWNGTEWTAPETIATIGLRRTTRSSTTSGRSPGGHSGCVRSTTSRRTRSAPSEAVPAFRAVAARRNRLGVPGDAAGGHQVRREPPPYQRPVVPRGVRTARRRTERRLGHAVVGQRSEALGARRGRVSPPAESG